jgi:hypothetical protein
LKEAPLEGPPLASAILVEANLAEGAEQRSLEDANVLAEHEAVADRLARQTAWKSKALADLRMCRKDLALLELHDPGRKAAGHPEMRSQSDEAGRHIGLPAHLGNSERVAILGDRLDHLRAARFFPGRHPGHGLEEVEPRDVVEISRAFRIELSTDAGHYLRTDRRQLSPLEHGDRGPSDPDR